MNSRIETDGILTRLGLQLYVIAEYTKTGSYLWRPSLTETFNELGVPNDKNDTKEMEMRGYIKFPADRYVEVSETGLQKAKEMNDLVPDELKRRVSKRRSDERTYARMEQAQLGM